MSISNQLAVLVDSKKSFISGLCLLLLVTLATRLVILYEFLNDNPFSEVFFSDDWVYWVMAGAKAAGHWIEETPFLSAPLFPYVLGIIRWAGGNLTSVYVLQLLLGLISVLLIAVGTRERFGAYAGFIAATLFAFSKEPAMAFTRIMADSLQLFLVTLVWFLWCRLSTRSDRSITQIIMTGLIIGLLVLAWPPAQLILIGYGIWLFFSTDASLKRKLFFSFGGLLAGLLIISPATIHNFQTDGDFVLVSANAGINLLQGNNENARGIITPIAGIRTDRQHMYEDASRVYAQANGNVDSWKKMDAYFRDLAIDFMISQPGKSLTLLVEKFYWFLSSTDYDNISVLSLEQDHGLYQWVKLAPIELPWLMGLAFLGVIILLKDSKRHTPELLLLGLTIFVCVVFHYSARYRLPAAPILCILSAVTFTQWQRIPLAQVLRYTIAFIPFAFLIINSITGFASVEFMRKDTATKISHAYIEVGDRRVRAGHYQAAEAYYRKAVDADPDYETPYLRLAQLGVKIRQTDLTKRWATELAKKKHPQTTIALKALFNAQLADQNYRSATETLEQIIILNPSDLTLKQDLIWLLSSSPDPEARDPDKALSLAREFLGYTQGTDQLAGLVALAAAQLSAGDKPAADSTIEKTIKRARRAGLADSIATLEQLRKDIQTKNIFDYQPAPFKLADPWDPSRPHPMDLLEY